MINEKHEHKSEIYVHMIVIHTHTHTHTYTRTHIVHPILYIILFLRTIPLPYLDQVVIDQLGLL